MLAGCGRRRGHAPPAGLRWKMAAGLTATLRGNPIEHGNIRVIKSSGQARNAATGLRYPNLRTRDNRGNARDSGAITARDRPQFSYSINTFAQTTARPPGYRLQRRPQLAHAVGGFSDKSALRKSR